MGIYATFIFDFFIFNTPRATIIAPIALKPPPSPIILAVFSDSTELNRKITPPIIIKIPVIISNIPIPMKGGFFEIKNATKMFQKCMIVTILTMKNIVKNAILNFIII